MLCKKITKTDVTDGSDKLLALGWANITDVTDGFLLFLTYSVITLYNRNSKYPSEVSVKGNSLSAIPLPSNPGKIDWNRRNAISTKT